MNDIGAETYRLSAADELLLRARAATDTGHRTPLDEAISAFGYNRAELEAELEADRLAGRD